MHLSSSNVSTDPTLAALAFAAMAPVAPAASQPPAAPEKARGFEAMFAEISGEESDPESADDPKETSSGAADPTAGLHLLASSMGAPHGIAAAQEEASAPSAVSSEIPAAGVAMSGLGESPETLAADSNAAADEAGAAAEDEADETAAGDPAYSVRGDEGEPIEGSEQEATPDRLSQETARAGAEQHVDNVRRRAVLSRSTELSASSDGGQAEEIMAGEANFAEARGVSPTSRFLEEETADKDFVTTAEEALTPDTDGVGTGVANAMSAMSFESSTASYSSLASELAGAGVGAEAAAGEVVAEQGTAVREAFSSAHQAVEAALKTADRMSARQSAVNLQFSVGDSQLDVRVELHGTELRTTFRTESVELRTALAREWQAISGNADRGFRIAPAVFAGADTSSQNAFSGDASSRQHGRDAQRQTAPVMELPAFSRADGSPAAADTAAAGLRALPTALRSNHRLLSFA